MAQRIQDEFGELARVINRISFALIPVSARHRFSLILVAAALIVIAIGPATLASRLASNVGLVMLNRLLAHDLVEHYNLRPGPGLDEVKHWLSLATELDATNEMAWQGQGLIAVARNQISKALEIFRRIGLSAADLNVRGNDAAARGAGSEAILWYQMAAQIDPDLSDAYTFQAMLYEQIARPDLALDAYMAALSRRAFSSSELEQKAWHRAGLLVEDQGSASDLVDLYRRAVTALPGDAYLHAALGRAIYRATGQRAEAEAELRHAIQIEPRIISAYIFLADILLHENQPEMALHTALQALTIAPDSVEARIYVGRAYLAQRQFERARLMLKQALEIAPTNPSAHFWMGQVALSTEQVDASIKHFRLAAELAPDIFVHWYYLGEALRLNRDLEGATAAYRMAQQKDPSNPMPAKRIAEIAGP